MTHWALRNPSGNLIEENQEQKRHYPQNQTPRNPPVGALVSDFNQVDKLYSFKIDTDDKIKKEEPFVMASNKFECHICGRELKSKKTFDMHMKRHRSTSKHTCKICGASYKDVANLKQHTNIHKGIFPYKCRSCDKTFPSSNKRLAHKVSVHQSARFRCGLCKRDFKVLRNFRNHMRLHDNPKPYSCTHCSTSFNSAEILSLHEKLHSKHAFESNPTCSPETLVSSNSTQQEIEQDASSKDEGLANDIYVLSLQEANNVLSGITVQEMNLQYDSDLSDKTNLDSSVLVSGGFQCDICLKRYTSHQNLKNHMRLHTDQKLFACSECGQSFNWESGLLRHKRKNSCVRVQRKLARANAPMSCSICNKHFKSYKGCQLHIRRCIKKVDNGVPVSIKSKRRLKCGKCDQIFDSRIELGDHSRLCSTAKIFKCSDCTKSYKSEKKLGLHLKLCQKDRTNSTKCITNSTKCIKSVDMLEKSDENVKYFDSGIETTSKTSKDLSIKQSMHCRSNDLDKSTSLIGSSSNFQQEEVLAITNDSTPVKCHNSTIEYFCKFCERSFVSENKLRRHVSSHNTKATFKCGKCDQRFPTKSICLSHMKRRHQLCRYSCTVCMRSFRCKRKLKNHLKTHVDRISATNSEACQPVSLVQRRDTAQNSPDTKTATDLFDAMQGTEQWTAEEFELEYN